MKGLGSFIPQLTFILFSGFVCAASGFNAPDVLPGGRRMVSMRQGWVSQIEQKFSSEGQLQSLSQLSRINFDYERLSGIRPEITELRDVLNSFGNFGIGNDIHLGRIDINLKPEVSYSVPTVAFGVTDALTIGLGIPIISYKNRVRLDRVEGNVNQLKEIYGGVNAELDGALKELDVDIVGEFKSYLRERGYKEVRSQNKSYMGDIQVAALYAFPWGKDTINLSTTTINLPTGPADDPDDILDLGIFGETYVEQELLASVQVIPSYFIRTGASYRLTLPDETIARVPLNEEDELPDVSQKENLSRDLGDTIRVFSSIHHKFLKFFEWGFGYEYIGRSQDSYSGERGSRYDLLAADTESSRHMMKFGISFNTIDYYLETKSLLPMFLELRVSDIFRGTNINRQLTQELILQIYF